MTFAELLSEVYSITGRADLVTLTKSAIKSATLKAHNTDFYSKDIYETPILFDTSDYRHSLDIISIISNYRALKYLRKYDRATESASEFFTIITPEEVLDKYNREHLDVCYVAGRVIEIKSSTQFDTVLIGCYVAPTIVEDNFSSWIADLYPYAIIHEAARYVFTSISQLDEANGQKALVAEQYSELKINALSDVGY